MNFYKRFIGDIQAKTGHLSLAEFGAYDRLLDHYYSTEKPLKTASECYRICRAMSSKEKACVDMVLSTFFVETENGFTQSKADKIIAAALPLIAAARANGAKGGRPERHKPETQQEPNGLLDSPISETQKVKKQKATQSQSQTTLVPKVVVALVGIPELLADGLTEQTACEWLAHRSRKGSKLTARAWGSIKKESDKAGWTYEDAVVKALARGWTGFEAEWVSGHNGHNGHNGHQPETFKQRDARDVRKRWEQATGGKHPDSDPEDLLRIAQ